MHIVLWPVGTAVVILSWLLVLFTIELVSISLVGVPGLLLVGDVVAFNRTPVTVCIVLFAVPGLLLVGDGVALN